MGRRNPARIRKMKKTFIIPGDPVGKARPRIGRNGVVYTPKKTTDYEKLVRLCYRGGSFGDANVKIEIIARKAMPKSWTLKKKQSLNGKPGAYKPDADNIAKIILDALNGLAYDDDKQVTDVQVKKYWAVDGGVKVIIESLEQEI